MRSGTGGVVGTAEVVGAAVVDDVLATGEVVVAVDGGAGCTDEGAEDADDADDGSDPPPHDVTSSAVARRSAARTRRPVTIRPRPWP